MANEFGSLFRRLREAAGVSMGQLARYLGVSTPYLSDVERGRRAPLTEGRIRQASSYLGLDEKNATQLVGAAAESRGFFELGLDAVSQTKFELGAALARRWPSLGDDRARKVLEELEKGDE